MPKGRTVLASEGPSRVPSPSLSKKAKKTIGVIRTRVRPRGFGIGGTIAKIEKPKKPDTKVKWKLGLSRFGNKKIPGKIRGKARAGFKVDIKF